MNNFPYLNNPFFLKEFDKLRIKVQYLKINVLTFFDERVIAEISGDSLGGNISIDGSSAMRRTANLSMIVRDDKYSETNIKQLLGLNKKVEIFIGFKNTTGEYEDYPILWFPQGIYVIISQNISHGLDGTNISLTLHDKMALLNGECGGVLPASVVFSQIEDINEKGEIEISQPTIYQIIFELVNHFGGEQLGKILISDVDNKIKKVMKWTGSIPLYLYQEINEDGTSYCHFDTNYENLVDRKTHGGGGEIKSFSYGQDVGYILTDFVYPDELIGNAGDTVVTILDQIKETLGNYQYFYDIEGNFRFQEIKNYLNTSYSTSLIENLSANDYSVDYTNGQSVYTFEDADIIQSYSNSPQFQQIKNDFLVWGKRTSVEGKQVPIRYHLAIDTKPAPGNKYKVFFFTDPDDGITKAKKPNEYSSRQDFPTKGDAGQYYLAADTGIIYKWNTEVFAYEQTPYILENIQATDWRTELYMSGVASQPFGLESNYYYTELKNEWPKIYDIRNGEFFEEFIVEPSNADYFLDFIQGTDSIYDLNIQNIGRRTATLVDDSINCIFEPDNPDIVIIEADAPDTQEQRTECENRHQQYAQVNSSIYNMLINGGVLKSAYEEIRTELYQYTSYSEQISLTVLPIYYLEPNTRITVEDSESDIHGDYIIKTISLPLDINGTMSLSCSRVGERI